jgi:hypothetical protein
VQRPLPVRREPADLTELNGLVTAVDRLLTSFHASAGQWGRTEPALSQRTILTALAYLMLQTGKPVVAASIRDLGLMCAVRSQPLDNPRPHRPSTCGCIRCRA